MGLMPPLKKISVILLLIFLFTDVKILAQSNLLINGGFEDINTCVEYNSECGVEGWFYLQEIKAQMMSNEQGLNFLGTNSLAVSYKWSGYTGLSPLIGTILPCRLRKDSVYIFKGIISAVLNEKLIFKPGVSMGEKFFVPKKPFSAKLKVDSISEIKQIPRTNFYSFNYRFVATGDERYLTFGCFIVEDSSSKMQMKGIPYVTVTMDNFELIAANGRETGCADFETNRKKIYKYDYRHRDMDHALYSTGELPIRFNNDDQNILTEIQPPQKTLRTDTLKLGDVLFDFNKALLKPDGVSKLVKYFQTSSNQTIDSIYIEGHTDSIGTDQRNKLLSQQRSETVKTWLLQQAGISETKIQIHSFGRSRPVASNKTAEGRALNRRVEIIVFRQSVEE